jgi:dienelactone hydrolase
MTIRRLLAAGSLAGLILATTLPTGAGARPAQPNVVVQVKPLRALIDTRTSFVVKNLHPAQTVKLTLTSIDANPTSPVTWTSSTRYKANASGMIDVSVATSLPGSNFAGVVDPGMPFDALKGPPPPCATGSLVYTWPGDATTPASGVYPYTFTWSAPNYRVFVLKVLSATGTQLASAKIWRADATTGETRTVLADNQAGYGEYFAPAPSANATLRPAVLMFGGSEGGLSPILQRAASLLAARGIPTLALAYFQGKCGTLTAVMPGQMLPASFPGSSLSDIPLEYFQEADVWLAAQPGVDPNKIFVSGTSRGSEAALLLAHEAQYPTSWGAFNVYGVIANVPNSSVCGQCPPGAWTRGGVAFSNGTVIPVNDIPGPLFLDCAGVDHVWFWPGTGNGCMYDDNIEQARMQPAQDVDLQCSSAGHGLGALVPYLPYSPGGALVNKRADAVVWPRLLAFVIPTTAGGTPAC